MNDIIFFGIPLAGGAVYIIVQEAKGLGAKGKQVRLARIGAALGLATLYEADKLVPAIVGPVAEGLMLAVGLLLLAAGYRNQSKDKGSNAGN